LKAKREHLIEQGVAPEKVMEFTRLKGKKKKENSK